MKLGGLQGLQSDSLRKQALTHRSAGRPNNERLEFFGDALLDLVISEALLDRLPRADEGTLTRVRASLVRESSLATIARRLKLGEQLILGPGELKSGGHRRDSILADALEAVIAAVYLDRGFEAARAQVLEWFAPELAALDDNAGKDAKTRLQEWLQARRQPLPVYALMETVGEEHAQQFRVSCSVEDPAASVEAVGRSRRGAEQAAAELMLQRLEESV